MGFIKKCVILKNGRMYILWLAAILLITQIPFIAYASADFVMISEITPANMPPGVTLKTIGPSTVITGQPHFFVTNVVTSYHPLSGTIRWEVLGGGSGTTISGPEPIHINIIPGALSIANAVLRIAPDEPATTLTLRTILQVGEETAILDKIVFVGQIQPAPTPTFTPVPSLPPGMWPMVPPVPRPPPPPPPPMPASRPPGRPLSPFAPISTPGRLAPVPMPGQVPLADPVEAPEMMLYFQPLSVNLNGRLFNFADQDAILVRGTSFIPVGPLFAHLGYNVAWDNDAATARLTLGNIDIIISEGERQFTVSGVNHMLPAAPMRVNDRLMVPFVALFESIGAATHRDDGGTVHIYTR